MTEPAQLAKAALRRLALSKREPTPGNFARAWREEGGPPVRKSGHRGFGSFLLERTLASDLQGRVDVDYEPTGVTCLIEMPMPETGGDACPG